MTRQLKQVSFTLPFPPSVNGYWRSITKGPLAGRVLISERGREFRTACEREIFRQQVPRKGLTGRLAVRIVACVPDRRARDLDNLLKGTLDGLHHSFVIRDDSDIDELTIVRGPIVSGGRLEMDIRELATEPTESIDLFENVG